MKNTILVVLVTLFLSLNVYAEVPSHFHVGRGIADITGPVYGVQLWGFGREDQIGEGLHIRQKARAFIVVDKQSDKRVVFVSADIGSIEHHITLEVLDRLQLQFGATYRLDNVVLSATHTHAAPTGYWHSRSMLGLDGGYYPEHFNNIVDGIVEAIAKAHRDLAPGQILINKGRVNNAGINRSLNAYMQNPQSERDQYANSIDKEMTLLKFSHASGNIGLLNWYAVHPTSMTFFNRLISGDHKGYASLNVERAMGVTYGQAPEFVAAFAQSNAGDVTPNINLNNTGPGKDDFESTKIIGDRQVEVALELFANATEALQSGVDYRQMYVDLSRYEVDDALTGAGTQFTCPSAYGYSFAGGSTEDGGGHFLFREGMTEQSFVLDFLIQFLTGAPKWTQPVKNCQAPKAILFETGTGTPPLQSQIRSMSLIKIGQLAILALPSEVTTMAGRRLRQTVKSVLGDQVEHIVIAGYSNGYAGYVTTPEEYELQQYEAGHTLHGRWTLPAYQQVVTQLAEAMRNGAILETMVEYDDWRGQSPELALYNLQTNPVPYRDDLDLSMPLERSVITQGDLVTVEFRSSNPTAHYDRHQHYLSIEAEQDNGWVQVADDHDWSTKIRWVKSKNPVALVAQVTWQTQDDTPVGRYRIKHWGKVRLADGSLKPFAATSDVITVRKP